MDKRDVTPMNVGFFPDYCINLDLALWEKTRTKQKQKIHERI